MVSHGVLTIPSFLVAIPLDLDSQLNWARGNDKSYWGRNFRRRRRCRET